MRSRKTVRFSELSRPLIICTAQKHIYSFTPLLIYKWLNSRSEHDQFFDLDVTPRRKPEVRNALVSK